MQNFGFALVILLSEPWKGSGNVGAEPSVRTGLIRQGGVSKVADLNTLLPFPGGMGPIGPWTIVARAAQCKTRNTKHNTCSELDG